ncbi:MAG: hypothetical protein IGS48_10775 [Oscillatoriales cyanobacterium C42_A2020_001]|nr:hypothetical protein [Leptolyngbyaceae cyanobacterium C42_A2020_001]
MDLQHLKWTKNIKPKGDEPWAYEQHGVGSLFKLAWRDGEANASKPLVEVLWVISWNNLPISAKADEVFGYSEVLNYQGGNVMELENIIPKHWESKGGLEAFRSHVLSQLNLA